jgi:hypothetical protein
MHVARRLSVLMFSLAVAACASAESGPSRAPASARQVEYSCASDADCTVKDVGGCCGYTPACVNRASRTFAAEVAAECRKSGRAGICGFPVIEACGCVEGRCAARRANVPAR